MFATLLPRKPILGDFRNRIANLGEALKHGLEVFGVEHKQSAFRQGDYRRVAHGRVQESDLAEEVPLSKDQRFGVQLNLDLAGRNKIGTYMRESPSLARTSGGTHFDVLQDP